jgi:tRNA pseudouridine(38-40) synthase
LNGIAPELYFSAAAQVPEEFRVRAAARRVYRYYDPVPVPSPTLRKQATRLFTGSVDVRSLGRGVPPYQPQWRSIESVVSRTMRGRTLIEVRAPSFVWGMVRKIVAALREVDSERLTVSQLGRALQGRLRLTLPMAEPEPLVLWEVEYPVAWEVRWSGPTRHQATWARTARDGVWVRSQVLRALANPD